MLKDLLIRMWTRILRPFLFMCSVVFVKGGDGYPGSGVISSNEVKFEVEEVNERCT